MQRNFLTVQEVSLLLSMSKWSVYQLIKNDPHFPYLNVGIKKKLIIDAEKLTRWSSKRTFAEKSNNHFIPTSHQLLSGAF